MFPARLFMGMVFFIICGWVLGGIAEGQTQVITQSQSGDIMGMVANSQTTTIDTNSIGAITYVNQTLDWINKVIFFDWTVFYDVYYSGYTSATCVTAGGVWQAATSTCKIPNIWINLRIVLIFVFSLTLLITAALLWRRLTLG